MANKLFRSRTVIYYCFKLFQFSQIFISWLKSLVNPCLQSVTELAWNWTEISCVLCCYCISKLSTSQPPSVYVEYFSMPMIFKVRTLHFDVEFFNSGFFFFLYVCTDHCVSRVLFSVELLSSTWCIRKSLCTQIGRLSRRGTIR